MGYIMPAKIKKTLRKKIESLITKWEKRIEKEDNAAATTGEGDIDLAYGRMCAQEECLEELRKAIK